ncbi:MAG: universal stress protein [bacterium]
MFKEIYVPFDNSEHSRAALDIAMGFAAFDGGTVVGSHVYAAKLHDWRFRALESGLPEQFQQETNLERQRVIHESLITSGLELITDSYLTVMEKLCEAEKVAFRGVSLEGRNWQALVGDVREQHYDLVLMGALGLGRTPESLVGTVCERVARRVEADLLVVREPAPAPASAPVVACLDGSARAWGGFDLALNLALRTGRPLVAVAAFDPYFHYTLFDSLKTVLTGEAKEVFNFEQQERLHEQIIDSGLAKIYQSHLEIAAKLAGDQGCPVETVLLDGKPSARILRFARDARPWLMVLGRTGIHGGGEMDLGGVAEQLLRLAPCNLLLAAGEMNPPDEYVAGATTAWSEEAGARMQNAPAHAKGVAMAAIQRFAIAEGYTMITSAVVDQALEEILPPAARAAMGIGKTKVPATVEERGRLSLSYLCPSCRYVHARKRPEACPVCGARGSLFKVLSRGEAAPAEEFQEMETFDGVTLSWSRGALTLLADIPDFFLNKRARHQIEKQARSRNLSEISTEFAREVLGEGGVALNTAQRDSGVPEPVENPSVGSPGSGGEALQPPAPGWSSEGWQRLLQAPEGFMRDRARAFIEAYASRIGATEISLAVADAGMAEARGEMVAGPEGG